MSETTVKKAPVWFWVVAVLALLWNLLGLLAFGGTIMILNSADVMAALPPEQQAIYADYPGWALAAFAVAVFGGLLGSIFLLMKSGLARILFIISLVALLVSDYYTFAVARMQEVSGSGTFIMPALVLLITLFLIWLSGKAARDFK
ncbi:hypothetical protein [Aquisalinus flavus]|uniref:Sugar transporter n=1 Tax=Aquisalinus flavus TaxID=1526572 RepID=A0A8J2Y803_9PROT|nr:hypothetical protein [Aquisalinus flavus]MBD0426112.1 hypothetical protein [Aquisalinus flavus]UNE48303.1 hypothetical protein FF099_09715 [Aquisalinus flavus]GGD10546.1 hypothetical protein GCM10011342_19270 [Aquisalinus flavus]